LSEPIATKDVEQKAADVDDELQYWAYDDCVHPKVRMVIAMSLKKEK
jgi:hypothetical protein